MVYLYYISCLRYTTLVGNRRCLSSLAGSLKEKLAIYSKYIR